MFEYIKTKYKQFIALIIGVFIIGGVYAAIPNDTPVIVLEKISIVEQLKNKTAIEKAEIKSRELAKVKIGKLKKDNLDIEIIGDIKAIEINGSHGIEFFAKAFKNNKQLGFSKDGSVEIERFRIFNPPVLVDDDNGDIIRKWTDEITGEVKQRKLKYNPEEAIRQSLSHTIGLVGKENTKIIKGKVGNTTSTFYSAAGANSPVDGATVRESDGQNWASHRANDTGTSAQNTSTTGLIVQSEDPGDNSYPLSRAAFLFDTSALPDTDTLNSATFSISSTANGNNTESTNPADLALVSVNLASNAAVTTSDYAIANWGSTLFASIYDLGTFIGSSGYHNMTFNASGLANISKTGISPFAIRGKNDIDNNAPTARSYGFGYYADETGTANDPKLVVVHEAVGAERRIIITQ